MTTDSDFLEDHRCHRLEVESGLQADLQLSQYTCSEPCQSYSTPQKDDDKHCQVSEPHR